MDKYIQKIMTKDGAKQIDYNALANLPMINQDDSVDVEKTINASNIVLEQSVEANSVISDTIIGTTVQGNVGEFENIYNKTDIDNKIDKINYDGLYVKGETYSGKASNKGVRLHKFVGKTVQDGVPTSDSPVEIQNTKITEIYSGTNQLFDASKLATTSMGGATVTNNNDGSFTVSGSGTLSIDFLKDYIFSNEETKKILKQGTLKLKDTGNTMPTCMAGLVPLDDTSFISGKKLNNVTSSITITESDLNASRLRLSFYGYKEGSIKTGTVKPMLYQDGDGTWEPFKRASVDTSLTLPDGDVYEGGVAIRKKSIVELTSSMDWQINSLNTRIYTIIVGLAIKTNSDIKSNYFTKGSWVEDQKNTICLGNGLNAVVGVSKSQFGTVEAFKAWLDEKKSQDKPCIILADLETPTIETLKVPTIPSYYPNTNIWTDNELPTDIEWELLANSDNSLQVEELEKKIEELQTTMLELKTKGVI